MWGWGSGGGGGGQIKISERRIKGYKEGMENTFNFDPSIRTKSVIQQVCRLTC